MRKGGSQLFFWHWSSKTDRSIHQRCSVKKGILKNFADFTAGLQVAILLKRNPSTVFSCEICKKLKNIYSEEHLLTATSEKRLKRWLFFSPKFGVVHSFKKRNTYKNISMKKTEEAWTILCSIPYMSPRCSGKVTTNEKPNAIKLCRTWKLTARPYFKTTLAPSPTKKKLGLP